MDPSQFWIKFVLAVLATWRLTHLIVSEDGPADSVVRLRMSLADSSIGRLVDCFGCLSIWIAVPFAFFVSTRPLDTFLIWLALSGAAFLLERMSPVPVVIEHVPEETTGGATHGMLRPEAPSPEQTAGDKRVDAKADQRLATSK
jgi:hypothetical protein